MNELAERKRLLMAEAELHRTLIAKEVNSQRSRVRSFSGRLEQLRGGILPWFAAASAVLGVLASRRGWRGARWLAAAGGFFRWVQQIRLRS